MRRDDIREPHAVDLQPVEAASVKPVGGADRAPAAAEPRGLGLESELQLVDAMRGAAQRNDTEALRGLLESYRGSFPDGQLRQEVSELALRALPASR